MHLYKSLGLLLKEIEKLKNAIVLFPRETHNSVSSFCRGASEALLFHKSETFFYKCHVFNLFFIIMVVSYVFNKICKLTTKYI